MQLTFQFLDISQSNFLILDLSIVFIVSIADNNWSFVVITWVWLVEQLWSVNDWSVWIEHSDQFSINSVQWESIVVIEDWLSLLIEQ